MITKTLQTRCCIAGGGPAGIMLGFLLARAGIEVVVLEKWGDFLRDFRGDTIHPSTMQVMNELGLIDKFMALPHDEARQMKVHISGKEFAMADFSTLKINYPFVAFIPQSDFLNFISGEAKKYSTFHLMMNAEATDLIEENGKMVGIKAKSGEDTIEIRAELTVGADGRSSTIREKAKLQVEDFGAPMDVLWFSLPNSGPRAFEAMFYADKGKIFLMLNRGTYWQCGFIIEKGSFDKIKAKGLDAFKQGIAELNTPVSNVVNEIKDWEQVKLLTVKVDHLTQWYKPGLICIGDSAHAMSPVGGVGINLAIQDAIASANILIPAFRNGHPIIDNLKAIQTRRSSPARRTQRMQILIQKNLIKPILTSQKPVKLPLPLRILSQFAFFRRIPAKTVGVGFRPEHIEHN
jgi:2-polyprenyl-6-methoxyphenol hydroxylase-like FAD-dependent oxidoreductase